MMLVVSVNWLGLVNILAHHGNKLNSHAPQLEIPSAKAILMEAIVLNVLKQAKVLLSGNLPLLPARSKSVVLRLMNRSAVKDVIVETLHGQPSMFLMVGRIPVNNLKIVGPVPRGQQRWSPIQLAARLGRRVRLVELGHIGLDGAKVPVNPANKRLVDDIGGDDVVFGVFSSGRDNGGDDGVFDVDLAKHVSSTIQSTLDVAFLCFFWGIHTISSSILTYKTSS